MAARFMIGSGNWSSTGSWSTTSGGATGAAVPTSADDVTLDSHSTALTIDATSTCKTFTEASGFVGTVTHNAFVLTVAGSVTFIAGSTYSPAAFNSSLPALTISATGTLTTGGLLMPYINVGAATTLTLGDNLTFAASSNLKCILSGALNLNGKTLSGNNATTNRISLQSNTLGTARTVTIAGGTFANADFTDIQFSSPSSLDLSAIAGKSGDCGGNSLTGGGSTLTFTLATVQTYTGTTGLMSDVTKWTSRVPLPQDTVSFAGCTGGTVSIDVVRFGADVSWAGATGSPTWTTIGAASNAIMYGSLTLIGGMTPNTGNSIIFAGRGNHTITSAGKAFGANVFFNGPGGTYTLQDAYSATTAASTTTVSAGTLTTNGFSVTCGNFAVLAAGTVVPSTSIFTLTNTAVATVWNMNASATFSGASTTLIVSTASANTRTFASGGKTYGTITYTVAGSTGALVITGALTCTTLNFSDATNARTLTLPAATTVTLASGGTFNVNGSAGKLVTLNSSVGASAATLAGTAAQLQNCDYLTIQDSTATPATTFYAGHHSSSVSNVSGWVFGVAYTGLLSSSIAHSMALGRVQGASRALSSSIAQSTSITRGGTLGRLLSSSIAHAGALSRSVGVARALSSAIAHSLTVSRLYGAVRALSSSIPQTSTTTRQEGVPRQISSSIVHAVTLTRAWSQTRSIASTIAHTMTLTRAGAFTRLLSSSIAHTLTIARTEGRTRTISSSIDHSVSVSRIWGQGRAITSAIAHTVTLTRRGTFTRQISSSIAHTVTLLSLRVRPAAIRAAYAAALRLATYAPATRLATFAAALRLRIFAATGTYQQAGGQIMLSTPVGTGAAYIGPLEARRPFVQDLRDRLAPGETVSSVTVTAQMTLPGSLTKVAAPGFVVSWSLCGSVSSIVVDTGGIGADATTQAHLTDPTYPGYPATLQTVVGGGAVTAVSVTNDGGLAYVAAPVVSFTGAGSGITAHAFAPTSGVVYLLGNGAQVVGATYYVSIAWTTSSDPSGVEQVAVPGLPCQAG